MLPLPSSSDDALLQGLAGAWEDVALAPSYTASGARKSMRPGVTSLKSLGLRIKLLDHSAFVCWALLLGPSGCFWFLLVPSGSFGFLLGPSGSLLSSLNGFSAFAA